MCPRLHPAAFLAAPAAAVRPCAALRHSTTAPPPTDAAETLMRGGPVGAAEETHPDFAPRPISSGDEAEATEVEEIKKDMRETIADEEVVVFMKGLPDAPVCGFSKKLVDLLDHLGVEYTSFDVLAHPIVRSYVKELSDWPTIPQLFVKGDFVGGTDIIMEMAANGKLQQLLADSKIEHRADAKL